MPRDGEDQPQDELESTASTVADPASTQVAGTTDVDTTDGDEPTADGIEAFWRQFEGERDEAPASAARQADAQPATDADATTDAPARGEGSGASDDERWVRALKRDNVPESVIAAIRKDNPQEFARWGAKAAKRQADVDAFQNQPKPTKGAQDEPSRADAPIADGDPAASPTVEDGPLAARLGAEGAKELAALIERTKQSVREDVLREQQALELQRQSDAVVHAVRTAYGDKAPSAEAIVSRAAALGRKNPGTFSSLDELFRAAAAEIAGPIPQPRTVVGAQPTRPTASTTTRTAAASREEEIDDADAAFDLLSQGRTAVDVSTELLRRRRA
jgi:hypothetical protein